jgi:hypothetical protein
VLEIARLLPVKDHRHRAKSKKQQRAKSKEQRAKSKELQIWKKAFPSINGSHGERNRQPTSLLL